LIYCRSLKNLFEKAILETDISFSTQGGSCRLYNEDSHRSEEFVDAKCKTHLEHACYISVPV